MGEQGPAGGWQLLAMAQLRIGWLMTSSLATDGGSGTSARTGVFGSSQMNPSSRWAAHICQWLEVDYIGVIIGPDPIVRNGEVITAPDQRDKEDRSIRGYKKEAQEDAPESRQAGNRSDHQERLPHAHDPWSEGVLPVLH